jgi:hypothetical protein
MKAVLEALGLFWLLAVASAPAQAPGFEWTNDLGVIHDSISLDSLRTYVRQLSGDLPFAMNGTATYIKTRHKMQPGNELARAYLLQKLATYGQVPYQQQFSNSGFNVLLEQHGKRRPNQKYILCAHYDDMPATSAVAPGADDNASGTAAVLEAARILRSFQFPYTILFALWDEEEQGLIGSRYYAQGARSLGDSILGVINMDMIAFDSNGDFHANIHVRPVANSAQLAKRMLDINAAYSLGLITTIYDPGITASDHNSFWVNDYSAILLIEDNYYDFNRYYHSIRDSINKFNDLYFLQCSRLAITTLASFAVGELPAVPVPLVPVNVQANVPARSLFSWAAAREAVHYDLEISPVQDFSTPGLQLYDLAQTAWISSGLPNATTAYWRLRSSNRAGKSGWSTLVRFETAAADSESILLHRGWNLVSSPLLPVDSSLAQMLSPVREHLDVVHDQPGNAFSFSPGASQLKTWNAARAYWMHMNTADTLSIAGNPIYIIPMAIPLEPGWNQVGVLANEPMPISRALASIAGHFLLAKNGAGQVYWPGLNIDHIKQVAPGQGLQVFLSSADTLIYPRQQEVSNQTPVNGSQTSFVVAPEPADQSAVLLIRSNTVHAGDEITVYTDDHRIAGTAVADNSQAIITLWGIDVFNPVAVTGAALGQALYIKHRSNLDAREKSMQITSLVDAFRNEALIPALTFCPEAVWIAQATDQDLPVALALVQNYPNPFSKETTICYQLPQSAPVTLDVFNSRGQCLAVLQQGIQEAGIHEVKWQGDRCAGGVYFCRLRSGSTLLIRKMVLLD